MTAGARNPFASEAQRRYLFAAAARGEIDPAAVRRWARETPPGAALPERVGRPGKKPARGRRANAGGTTVVTMRRNRFGQFVGKLRRRRNPANPRRRKSRTTGRRRTTTRRRRR